MDNYLLCYTVKDNIEEGISIDEFESVVVDDPSTTMLKKAVLQIVPVLEPENPKSLNSVTESSISFLRLPSKSDKKSDDYVILAVDPSKWRLCYNRDSFGLLDPCGLTGLVILLVKKDTKHVLVKTNDRHTELCIDENSKPVIGKCNRASLIYDTVTNTAIKREVSKLPTQYLLASPKAGAKSARS